MHLYDYDLVVIGGGSGGVRAARLAASLGKRVAIAEEYRVGGIGVIRGCVSDRAQLTEAHKVRLVKTDLPELPRSILIAGGGYIAVEFANMFHGLGVEVMLIYRGREILQRLDQDLRRGLHAAMTAKGIRIPLPDVIKCVGRPDAGGLAARISNGASIAAEIVMLAVGRKPNTAGLGPEVAGVRTDEHGAIIVDACSPSSVPGICALGDVTNRVQLTPVAIHEAMCPIETEYKNNPVPPGYDLIATAVFSWPEVGTVGSSMPPAAGSLAPTFLATRPAKWRNCRAWR